MSKTNVLPYFPKLTYQYSIHTWHWKIILSLLLTEILQELLKSDFWYPCANVEANHYHCPEATLITCLRISDSSNTKCHITKVKNFEVIHYNPGNRQAPGDPLGFHSSTQSQRLSSTSKPSTKKKKKTLLHMPSGKSLLWLNSSLFGTQNDLPLNAADCLNPPPGENWRPAASSVHITSTAE